MSVGQYAQGLPCAVNFARSTVEDACGHGMKPKLESHLCACGSPQENRVNGMVEPAKTRFTGVVRWAWPVPENVTLKSQLAKVNSPALGLWRELSGR